MKNVDPDSVPKCGLLVLVPTDELMVLLEHLLENLGDHTPRLQRLRAMVLIELLYRFGVRTPELRTPEAYQLAWQCMFGDEVPPPQDLIAPSQMSPHERGWARH